MIVISDSSPLIALSRVSQLHIFKLLFGKIYISESVFQETVLQSNVLIQKEAILKGIDDFIIVEAATTDYLFKRTVDFGEKGLLNLALDKKADILIIDDRKAANEAKELGFRVIKTSTLLRRAEKSRLISSYSQVVSSLKKLKIYLPD